MTRIGIISDTHGYLHPHIIDRISLCDIILHAGDIGSLEVLERIRKIRPMHAVFGNIDGQDIRNECGETVNIMIEGVKIFMIHIGGYPGNYSPRARKLIQELKPDLFISGHSHILKVMPDKKHNLLHINPGACGKFGFQNKNTMAHLNIHQGAFKDLEIFEMNR